MPTPDLFDFDPERLTDYQPARVRHALTHHSTIYVNHLEIAQWLEHWADSMEELQAPAREDGGFIDALLQVAGHLRQADFVPDELILRDARSFHERALHAEWRREHPENGNIS